MLVYLGYIIVFIVIKQVKHISYISNTISNDQEKHELYTYKDLSYNKIDVNSYCKYKTCVRKCCPNGQEIKEGICSFGVVEQIKYEIETDKWNAANISEETDRKNYQDFVRNITPSAEDTWQFDFYLLKDGAIRIKLRDNETAKWVGASSLDYCVNKIYGDLLKKEHNVTLILKEETAKSYNNTNGNYFIIMVVGTIFTLVLFGVMFYYIKTMMLRIMRKSRLAFISTITLAYITMIAYYCLLVLRNYKITSTECRIISPVLHFFILSSFFWIDVLHFDLWQSIRNFRVHSITTNKDVDSAKFIWFSIFGWVIPFLMTVVAVVVDAAVETDSIFSFVKPPFDSCLGNHTQSIFYLYVPMTILTALSALFILLKLYNIWQLPRNYTDVLDIIKVITTKHRYPVRLKVWTIVLMSGLLELIPNVPSILYYTIHSFNISIGVPMYALFWYERCTYQLPYITCNIGEKISDIYKQAIGETTTSSSEDDIEEQDNTSMTVRTLPRNIETNRY